MGNENQHMRFYVKSSDGIAVPCVLFKRAEEFKSLLTSGHRIDIAGELSVNEYNGRQKIQMIVADIRRS